MRPSPNVQISVNTDENYAHVIVSGSVRFSDIQPMIMRLVETSGFSLSMNSIIDMRKAKVDVSAKDIEQTSTLFQAMQNERGRGGRLSILVSDDLTYGISRMLAVELEQVPIMTRVVKSYEEAHQWVTENDDAVYSFESA